ncbi:hypothetical protein PAEPH01_2328 [Pancytospora epiphaga]|nr:hypothetical protein PAEPH01_2328 [Pancytospora epiphaga]
MGKQAATNLGKMSGGLSTDTKFQDIFVNIYYPISNAPFALIEKNENLKKLFFLTITDRYTRFLEVYFQKTLKSDKIIEIIQNK